ncbi:hypothetical protein H9P43_003521 [Blastocladiella emersonii ATCC 22665]|nr:hypothetical protein H9P43_003521 [Blastocladiella emersonii ATCC 22665]
MTVLNVLVLDDCGTPTIPTTSTAGSNAAPTAPTTGTSSYSSFVGSDEVNLFVITSKGGLSAQDKARARAYVELDSPTTDGTVELVARAWHEEYTLHRIYTKQEDLVIRAAFLRQMFGIREGLQPEAAIAFRDKTVMKDLAVGAGVAVPDYARLHSPTCLMSLVDRAGLPVIIKPSLGSASVGLHVLRTRAELSYYLANDFFGGGRIDASGRGQMDVSGSDVLAEAMLVDAPMYHVNGLATRGKLTHVWAFAYEATNLGFTKGKAYGNVGVTPDEPIYRDLVGAAERVLGAYAAAGMMPDRLAFHLELFHVTNPAQAARTRGGGKAAETHSDFVLCEIAARRPGGSIVSLMEKSLGQPFAALEFRYNLGLPLTPVTAAATTGKGKQQPATARPKSPTRAAAHASGLAHPHLRVADLLIPHKPHSLLAKMPHPGTFPLADAGVTYHPVATPSTSRVYTTFQVGTLNTVARFSLTHASMTRDTAVATLRQAEAWFNRNVEYISVTPTSTTTAASSETTALAKQPAASSNKLPSAVRRRAHRTFARTSLAVVHVPARRTAAAAIVEKTRRRVYARRAEGMALVKYSPARGAVALSRRLASRVLTPAAAGSVTRTAKGAGQLAIFRRTLGHTLVRRVWMRSRSVVPANAVKTPAAAVPLMSAEATAARALHNKQVAVRTAPRGHAASHTIVNKVAKKVGANTDPATGWWQGGKRAVLVGKGKESVRRANAV